MDKSHKRKVGLITAVVMIVGLFAAPASATKPDPESDLVEGHKIWICHATRSLSNPYVKILIDIAAWDVEDPDNNDHGPEHHKRTKDGVTWADYALENADEECSLDIPPPPPPPPPACPDEGSADFIVDFGGVFQLLDNPAGFKLLTVAAAIPAGTYDVVLISGDPNPGGEDQPNEKWRLQGDSPTAYTTDLPTSNNPITGIVDSGLSVTFNTDVTEVTAEHWSFVNGDSETANSVAPEFACLTRTGPSGG